MSGFLTAVIFLGIIIGFSIIMNKIYRCYWNKNLYYEIKPSDSAVFEGETITLVECLTNKAKLPLSWIHVSYRMSRFLVFLDNVSKKINRGEMRNLMYVAGANKSAIRKSTVLCSKRGYYKIEKLSISANNPLMTQFTADRREFKFELIVYPRIVDYDESVFLLKQEQGEMNNRRFVNPDLFTFKGIREYQQYDSFRQVNWSATAKTGALMSNVYDFTVSQDITLVLNLQRLETNDEYLHEEAIRLAAYICRNSLNKSISISLLCPSGDGEITRISPGVSGSQLEIINTALAFIDLEKANKTFPNDYSVDAKNSYVLISAYYGKDVQNEFSKLLEKSTDAVWIIPHCEGEIIKIAGENIVCMEVQFNAHS